MKNALLTMLLALLLAVGLSACGGEEPQPEETVPADVLGKADAAECTYKCIKCLPPNAPACEFRCVYVGKCETRCSSFDYCDVGYVWSTAACRCLPEVP